MTLTVTHFTMVILVVREVKLELAWTTPLRIYLANLIVGWKEGLGKIPPHKSNGEEHTFQSCLISKNMLFCGYKTPIWNTDMEYSTYIFGYEIIHL